MYASLFMYILKILLLVGRILCFFTFDNYFKEIRNSKMKIKPKSIRDGLSMGFKCLTFSLIFTIKQFFYLLKEMPERRNKVFGAVVALIIMALGCVFKPLVGVTDMSTKILEGVLHLLTDVLGDRVRKPARYERFIAVSD